MAGIDNITKQILSDAQEKADAIIRDAQAKSEAVIASATRKAATSQRNAQADALTMKSDLAKRTESQVGLRRRQDLLKVRQELIEQIIDQAYQKLDGLDDGAYFDTIEKLAVRTAHSNEKGSIVFNQKDLDRLPKNFEKQLNDDIRGKGGSLEVSEEAAPIENGFILRYKDPESDFGGIEENCTFRTLISEKKEQLTDIVHSILWPVSSEEKPHA